MKAPGSLAAQSPKYLTKQLSKTTWRDFERLFSSHPAPGAYPCWCMYNHRPGPTGETKDGSSVTRAQRNRRQKKALVERGCSHGILVYAQKEPVGWCQYGRKQELPRIDNNPKYRKLAFKARHDRLWRITCFVVDRKHRRRGVARTALRAALEAIREGGGGLVEGYPIKRLGAYAEYRGTLSMFESEGFNVVGPLGYSNVLVRRTI